MMKLHFFHDWKNIHSFGSVVYRECKKCGKRNIKNEKDIIRTAYIINLFNPYIQSRLYKWQKENIKEVA